MTLALLLAVALAPAGAAAHPAPLRGVGVEETLDAGPVLAPALEQAHTAPGVPVFVRLTVSPGEVTGDQATRWPALDERLALYAGLKVPVVLALGALARDRCRRALEGAAARARRAGRAAACAPTSSRRGPASPPPTSPSS